MLHFLLQTNLNEWLHSCFQIIREMARPNSSKQQNTTNRIKRNSRIAQRNDLISKSKEGVGGPGLNESPRRRILVYAGKPEEAIDQKIASWNPIDMLWKITDNNNFGDDGITMTPTEFEQAIKDRDIRLPSTEEQANWQVATKFR